MLSAVRVVFVGLPVVFSAFAAPACLARPGQLVQPKADIISVEILRHPMQTVSYSGAGVRAPHQPSSANGKAEQIAVEWFAHSPGIPPGTIVMLETIARRQTIVRNHIHRTSGKSEGNRTALFEIPPGQTRADGPVGEWRVRIIWRGRALATRASAGWEAARSPAQ